MKDILTSIAVLYGCTTLASLISNYLFSMRRFKKSLKNGERKLKYKELSMTSSTKLKNLRNFYKFSNRTDVIASLIPGIHIVYTADRVMKPKEYYEYLVDTKIEEINANELRERKKFLKLMKELEKMPDDLKEKLEDEEYMPSETDYIRALNLNRKPKGIILINIPVEETIPRKRY